MSLPTIFLTCRPRADVLAGTVRDDEFMADLSRVVNGTAPTDYLDPAVFFATSYPTRGIKELLKALCLRLSGKGGEAEGVEKMSREEAGYSAESAGTQAPGADTPRCRTMPSHHGMSDTPLAKKRRLIEDWLPIAALSEECGEPGGDPGKLVRGQRRPSRLSS